MPTLCHRAIALLLIPAACALFACGDDDTDNGTNPTNQPPAIQSVTATPDTFAAYSMVMVSVTASDPDGDNLDYLWVPRGTWLEVTSSSGALAEVSNCCVVNAMDSTYLLIVVDDNQGGQARDSIQIWVTP